MVKLYESFGRIESKSCCSISIEHNVKGTEDYLQGLHDIRALYRIFL